MDEELIRTCRDIRGFIEDIRFYTTLLVVVVALGLALASCGEAIRAYLDVKHQTEMLERCAGPMTIPDYWADPVTKMCGLRLDGALHGSREACPAILALPAFEKMRHCWDASK